MSPASFQTAPSRDILFYFFNRRMGRGGFEPPKQVAADLQSVPFGHSGIYPFLIIYIIADIKPMIGLEPITCWLQISCSANWATSAKWDLQGANLWPSACKADALPAELRSHICNSEFKQYNSGYYVSTHSTTPAGLEPATSAVTGRRSNQLSHEAIF